MGGGGSFLNRCYDIMYLYLGCGDELLTVKAIVAVAVHFVENDGVIFTRNTHCAHCVSK